MISLSQAPVRPAVAVTVSPTPFATVGGGFLKRSEPLFLGEQASSKDYSSVKDAMSAAAALSSNAGGSIYAVVASRGDAGAGQFQLRDVQQPVWKKGFFREDVVGFEGALLEPLAAQEAPGRMKFGFLSKFIEGHYGDRKETAHTGRLNFDRESPAMAGLTALVGPSWGYLVGREQLVGVRPTQPPVPPTPPVPPVPPTPPVPPVDPPRPPGGVDIVLVQDVTEAVRLAAEAARIIETVPAGDKGAEETKETRIKAFKTNMAAQSRLEKQFSVTTNSEAILSTLRRSDASLEDANWQLAKKPSPDGRFNGVDVPGALRDTKTAVDLLNGLLSELTKQAEAAAPVAA